MTPCSTAVAWQVQLGLQQQVPLQQWRQHSIQAARWLRPVMPPRMLQVQPREPLAVLLLLVLVLQLCASTPAARRCLHDSCGRLQAVCAQQTAGAEQSWLRLQASPEFSSRHWRHPHSHLGDLSACYCWRQSLVEQAACETQHLRDAHPERSRAA